MPICGPNPIRCSTRDYRTQNPGQRVINRVNSCFNETLAYLNDTRCLLPVDSPLCSVQASNSLIFPFHGLQAVHSTRTVSRIQGHAGIGDWQRVWPTPLLTSAYCSLSPCIGVSRNGVSWHLKRLMLWFHVQYNTINVATVLQALARLSQHALNCFVLPYCTWIQLCNKIESNKCFVLFYCSIYFILFCFIAHKTTPNYVKDSDVDQVKSFQSIWRDFNSLFQLNRIFQSFLFCFFFVSIFCFNSLCFCNY